MNSLRPNRGSRFLLAAIALPALLVCLTHCGKSDDEPSGVKAGANVLMGGVKAVKDPVDEEIYAFRIKTRQAYNSRRFDELETTAEKIRPAKELFPNGSWKILQYYESFDCREDEPANMWQLHDKIHKDWIAAKPNSITARVAYAHFLTGYAWHARGSGYANTVTDTGARLFEERLAAAREVLDEARKLPAKDPMFWYVGLRVALGEGWPKPQFDAFVAEAIAFEPKFWGYDSMRAYSLLPRWYGEEGDWEAYAAEAAARPNGLGAEVYARLAIRFRPDYDNIFRDTKISWPKTKEGLQIILKKYPTSLELLTHAAMLATLADDRPMAKELFDKLGNAYLPHVWKAPQEFERFRQQAGAAPLK